MRRGTGWLRHGALAGALVAVASTDTVWAQAGRAPVVRVDPVRAETVVETVPVLGRLVATRRVEVAAGIDGIVAEVRAEVGDRVAGGDVLLVIDRARLAPGLALRRAETLAAEAAVAAAEAEADLARQELRRADGLRGSAAFNAARLEDARRALDRAASEAAAARARLDAARAAADLAAVDLDRAEVRAPFAGVVTARHAERGGHVEEGATVFGLLDDASFEIEADVPLDRLAGLAPGAVVALRWPDGTAGEAVARALVPTENPLSRTRPVRFRPQALPAWPADQKTVTLDVPRAVPRLALTVAKDGVVFAPDSATAVVVNGSGQTELRRLTLGQVSGERIEVLGGLGEGDRVVVRGNERLGPGQAVQVDESPAPAGARS
jgi:RND family efflux transporter MFP subunit